MTTSQIASPEAELNTPDNRSALDRLSISLHWIVGWTIIGLLAMGIYMEENSAYHLYDLHKSIGALIFIAVVIRAWRRLRQGWPEPVSDYTRVEQLLSKITHYVLLIGSVLIPLSGLVMSIAGGHGLGILGLELIGENIDPANPDTSGLCQAPEAKRAGFAAYYAQNPAKWWDLGKNPPTARIPGFQTLAENDGARTFNMGGQGASGAALAAEFERFCTTKAASGAGVTAPVFIYEGAADTTVKSVHGDFWANNYPNIAQRRTYEGVGHTVQYRHWDQVLLDVAGMSDKSVMCVDGQSKLVPAASVKNIKDTGICAWK